MTERDDQDQVKDLGTQGQAEDGKEVLASLVVHPVRVVIPRTKLKDKRSVMKARGQ